MKLNFAKWLKKDEVATSTSCVANVPMRLFSSPVERIWPSQIDDGKKKRKKKIYISKIGY